MRAASEPHGEIRTMAAMNTTAPVIALDHPAALDVARVGRKAANLAAARAAGLPVAPGVVLTTEWDTADRATAAQVWRITSHDGARALVVPRSAAVRDRRRRADTGAVEPATVVHDLETMLDVIATLRAEDATTPVLLQPHVAGAWQGVLFADETARGWRATALAVARRAGHPDGDWVAAIDRAGRVSDVLSCDEVEGPPSEVLARVARVADRVAVAFDGAQDVEWIADEGGRVQLLRIRPVVRLLATTANGATRRSHRAHRPAARLEPVVAGSRARHDSAA
jgi:pyruvate,water dikinase